MDYSPGLEGVVAGTTAISNVEGAIGRLSYRGVSIEELVEMEYLDVMHLVLFDSLPDRMERDRLATFLFEHGRLTNEESELISRLPNSLHPMALVQSVIPLLQLHDVDFDDRGNEASQGLQIIAKYPMIIAEISRLKGGPGDTSLYDDSRDYLAGYLAMMNGKVLSQDAVTCFKVVQLLQMEHSFNAGTFAGRVIGSTLAGVPAVLSGSVGALSGVLHGGADQAALQAAREAGSPEAAADLVDGILASKGRLMGMGHREYRTVDPRSNIIKPMAERLCRGTAFEKDFDTLIAIESVFNQRMAEKGKEVWANLEFYKGVVYEALGIRPEYFTATFAMARSVGWLAHLLESRENNKIIRPAAHYIGRLVGELPSRPLS